MTARDTTQTGSERGWRAKLVFLGPAFIAGALQFGPGNTVSAASAGGNLGYTPLWLIALSTLLMLVYVDIGVRIGLAAPGTSIQSIKQALGTPLGFLTGLAIFALAFTFMVGNLLGVGVGLSLLVGGSASLWAIAAVAIGLVLLWARRFYRLLERIAIALVGVMLVSFAITAFASAPDWGAVARGFVPTTFGGEPTTALAVLGTNLSMYAAFYMTYTIREKGTRRENYRQTTLTDTLAGVIGPGVMTMFVVIAGASVVGEGQSVSSARDLANILEPALGRAAVAVFALGLLGAALSSVLGGLAAGGTTLADGLGWGDKIDIPRAKILSSLGLLASLVIVLTVGGLPVQLIILVNAATLFIFPFVATIMLVLANRRSTMGALANSGWQNVAGALGWLVVVGGALRLLVELV